jgi:hypothetical protein
MSAPSPGLFAKIKNEKKNEKKKIYEILIAEIEFCSKRFCFIILNTPGRSVKQESSFKLCKH